MTGVRGASVSRRESFLVRGRALGHPSGEGPRSEPSCVVMGPHETVWCDSGPRGENRGVQTLSRRQRHQFVEDGFVLVRELFDREVAEACCAIVAEAVGRHARGWSSPNHPVERFENYIHLQYGWHDGPFAEVARPGCRAVLDDLLGDGRWNWDESFGWWPVLFPGFASDQSLRDLGWHVDGDDRYPTLRVPEKAVVAIFYFSDAATGDGGTAVFPGSHLEVARLLADAVPAALSDDRVHQHIPRPTSDVDVVEVTGYAGDVLFAHPFLVHASNRKSLRPRTLRVQPLRRSARPSGVGADRGRAILGGAGSYPGARVALTIDDGHSALCIESPTTSDPVGTPQGPQ